MNEITVQDFVKPIQLDTAPPTEVKKKLRSYIKFAEALSHVTYDSIYLIDYYKKKFLYVSENSLFLCGKTAKQVQQAGYLFYLTHVPHDDLKLLLTINEAGFDFYKKISLEDKLNYSISCDFRIKQSNGHLTLINHKQVPLDLDALGNIWITLCFVSLSSNHTPGNIIIKSTANKKLYEYDLVLEKWNERQSVKFNSQEREILMLATQGFTVERIAKELFLSIDTIKFHRKKLFKKLKATNITEAVFSAVNLGVI